MPPTLILDPLQTRFASLKLHEHCKEFKDIWGREWLKALPEVHVVAVLTGTHIVRVIFKGDSRKVNYILHAHKQSYLPYHVMGLSKCVSFSPAPQNFPPNVDSSGWSSHIISS